jgi:WD40 repeat protein
MKWYISHLPFPIYLFRALVGVSNCLSLFHIQTIKTHTKFIQDVRYAPSGDHFASVGSDSKIFLYDGKEGTTIGEFVDSPHKGSIVCSCSLIAYLIVKLIGTLDGLFVGTGQQDTRHVVGGLYC